ncbi:lysophospholipid acyltransferase family protein [Streptodolium elevatio]|uniref:1-acyl-sn-glycerol-3-phosphate acyltransferase n=1 Tax=Streptodolium elevatio TaxID=3157996 RepID=A0ABV3DRJ2_9ACTN
MARRRIGFWYRVVVVVVKPLLLVFTKRDWRGMEHIPVEGGFVTAVNHISYVDPLTYAHFQYESGREAHFLAKSSLFKIPVVGRIIKGAGQIPVYRDSADAALAFRAAVEAVERGDCVAVYPEGTITRDKALWPMQGKTGAARIALTTGAPVIPVAQWGAQDLLAPYAKRPRLLPRKTMKVLAGPAVDLDEFRGRELTADVLRGATDRIMDAVTELLAKLREEPVPPRESRRKAKNTPGPQADPAATGPAEGDKPATGSAAGSPAETLSEAPAEPPAERPAERPTERTAEGGAA